MPDVEIQPVDVNASISLTIFQQAEVERERRAKVINAHGEALAAGQLRGTARIMARNPRDETAQAQFAERYRRRKESGQDLSVSAGTRRADSEREGGGEAGLMPRPANNGRKTHGGARWPKWPLPSIWPMPRKNDQMPEGSEHPAVRGPLRASRPWLLAALVAGLAIPSLAQDGTGLPPENAQDRRFASGWDCDLGYRIADGVCVALEMPANAFPTGRSYGTGWDCQHGFREIRGTICEAIAIPANAFLDASGLSWQCDRGYRKQRDGCTLIAVPENAYLNNRGIGAGWECDRGHVAKAGACIPIVIPDNAYATNANFGAAWRCERGFIATGGRCDPITVPDNSFLDDRAHGPGWQCDRGFEAQQDRCVAIDLPENAHLDRSGNRWQCDRGFQISEAGQCILTR